jgi:hypothetical protein
MRTGRRPPSLEEATFSAQSESGGTVGRRIRVLAQRGDARDEVAEDSVCQWGDGSVGICFLVVYIELGAAAAATSQR